jgi:hypothetical protein
MKKGYTQKVKHTCGCGLKGSMFFRDLSTLEIKFSPPLCTAFQNPMTSRVQNKKELKVFFEKRVFPTRGRSINTFFKFNFIKF